MSAINNNNNLNFPEDKDAPVLYSNNKKVIDYIIFGILSISTIVTVTFSLYIIIAKYII